MARLLLFDLDGTLLRTDKTLSPRTLDTLQKSREQGYLIGISTSRAIHNCMTFLPELTPDLFIASGGAVVQYRGEFIYTAEFSAEETRAMIDTARKVCGQDCEITVDSLTGPYWHYKIDPNKNDSTWGDTIYTDFHNFNEKALKFCVEIFEDDKAAKLKELLCDCDSARFEGGFWYKFTRKDATKETAIRKACQILGINLQDVTAFGDDIPDIGMLELCGTGIAMGNAFDAVKEAADLTIGSNDSDAIAEYLEGLDELCPQSPFI
jgi:Cof subfamily protein (haloacid dehalogenase superfamily)